MEKRGRRIRALVQLLRWSGLRIRDAVTLERARLQSNDDLLLYQAKTGVPIYVPLPTFPHLKPEDLRKIYGFTVGGALIKDKLFWIYTYDQHAELDPANSIVISEAGQQHPALALERRSGR